MGWTEEMVASIDGRLEELGREIAALTDARSALDGDSAASELRPRPARRASRRRKAVGRHRRHHHRAEPHGASLEQLLAASDGPSSTPALVKRTGAGREEVLAELERLERAGHVRRSGTRTVRWQLVTDEERVAARAAELAQRSRRRA